MGVDSRLRQRRQEGIIRLRPGQDRRHVDIVPGVAEPAPQAMNDPLETTEFRGSDDMKDHHGP